MRKQGLCPHCIGAADRLVSHGVALGADVVTHTIALLKIAHAHSITLDDLVEGMLDVNNLLDEPLPEKTGDLRVA